MPEILFDPMIRTYHYNAFTESIIGKHQDYSEWCAGNYMQVMVQTELENALGILDYLAGSAFGCCRLLDSIVDEKEEIMGSFSCFEQYIKDRIREGYAIYTHADEFYIPHRVSYRKDHFEHDLLLHHVDDETVSYIGYDSVGEYASYDISLRELYTAMHTANPMLRRLKKNNNRYRFSIKDFILMLDEYVNEKDSRENLNIYLDLQDEIPEFYEGKLSRPIRFGICMYDTLQKLLELYDVSDYFYDWRAFHLLWEHKQSVIKKMEYLTQHKYLSQDQNFIEQYQEIVDTARMIENLGLKYQITRSKKTSERMRELLEKMKQEKFILHQMKDYLAEGQI